MKTKHLFLVSAIAACFVVFLFVCNNCNAEKNATKKTSTKPANAAIPKVSDTVVYGPKMAELNVPHDSANRNPALVGGDSAKVRILKTKKGDFVLPGRGMLDIVVLFGDSTGAIERFITAGGKGDDKANAAYQYPMFGKIIVCGYFSDTAFFGGKRCVSRGGTDAFVSCWDYDGNLVWVATGGSAGDDYARSFELGRDEVGKIFVNVVGKSGSNSVRFGMAELLDPPNNSQQYTNVFAVLFTLDEGILVLDGFRWYVEE